MARRRSYTDNGSVGYSQASLNALAKGNYGKNTGRKSQYHTSQEQLNAIPKLEGMTRSADFEGTTSRKNYVDTDRARRRYAEGYTQRFGRQVDTTPSQPMEIKPVETSSNDNYVVSRERYNKLMQNGRLANDIRLLAEVNYKNANQDASVSQEWADEYGAKAITGGLSKKQFLTQLSKRYELTPRELEDMALTFHSDAYKQETEQYGQDLEKLGKENALLGSAGSFVGTIGGGVEGMYNTAVGALGGDDRFLSNIFSTTKKAPREGAKQTMKTDFGKGAYDLAMGVGDMFAGAAAGSAPVILAGNTANEAQQSAIQRGSSVRKASGYAAAAGALDYITNKIGLDKAKSLAVSSIKSTGIKGFLAKNAIAGLGEAGENVLQDIGQYYLDDLINGKNSELRQAFENKVASGMDTTDAFKETAKEYAVQLAKSAAIGFGMGSAMQGGATALPKIPEYVANKWAENKTLGIADPNIRAILDGVIPNAENLQQPVGKPGAIPETPDNRAIADTASPEKLQTPMEKVAGNRSVEEIDDVIQDVAPEINTRNYTDAEIAEIQNYVQQRDAIRAELEKNVNMFDLNAMAKYNDIRAQGKAMDAEMAQKYPELFTENGKFTGIPENGGEITPANVESAPVETPAETPARTPYNPTQDMSVYEGSKKYKGRIAEDDVADYGEIYGVDGNEAKFVVSGEMMVGGRPVKLYVLADGSHSNMQFTRDRSGVFHIEEMQRAPMDYFDPESERANAETPIQNELPAEESSIITSEDVNNGEVPPANPPLVTEPPRTNRTRESDVITNSAINADIISRYDYDNDPVLRDIAEYEVHSNDSIYNAALNNVKKNGAKLLEEYNTDQRAIDNDQDVDQAMLLLRNLKEQLKTASPEEAELLTNQRNMLLTRLRKMGTKYGQTIQAFAKWNDTPEGALINSNKMLADRAEVWEGQNQEVVEQNKAIAEQLDNIGREPQTTDYGRITNGDVKTRNTTNGRERTSTRMDRALARHGYDGSMDEAPGSPSARTPKTHEQHRAEVEASIRREFGSVADQLLTDKDFEVFTNFVENNVPIDIIADELAHRLNHGEFYTIDESTPVKKAKSAKLAKILEGMGDDSRKAKNQNGGTGYPEKSHATISEEVSNTLGDEYAALGLDTPTDVEFITIMLEENIPAWKMEDEISHRLMTGEWYSLDESIEPPKKINGKLQSALNSLTGEKPEKVELSLDEIREQVRNTLDREAASEGEFTDEDVNYLTNLIYNGATTEEIAQALNTKMATGTFAVSQDTQMKVNALFEYADKFDPNSKQACEAKAAAYKLLAEEVVGDASPFEKFEAWRYIAMLGNPKTMLRNLVGNTMFNGITSVSNGLAAITEGAIDRTSRAFGGKGIQRTKSILLPGKDNALISGAWEDAPNKRYAQLQGGKYEKNSMREKIASHKSVFNSKFMQLVEGAVDKGISDYPAIRTKYATSLAGWMKANGLDETAFGAEGKYERLKNQSLTRVLTNAERAEMDSLKQTMDALEKGRDFALKQAEYATFHEDNDIASAISEFARKNITSSNKGKRALGYMIEGIVPFKKTPANILRSGFEYSPLGALKSIKDTGKLIYENTGKRKKNLGDTYTKKSWWRGDESEVNRSLAADVIESWSKTLTGSGLAYLGYYLMSKGILNSSTSDEKYQDELEGKQNYSITINGKTYTLDWAAPGVMPLLLGAETKKIFGDNAIPDEEWYKHPDKIINSINSLLNPVFETSMLQGIQNVLETAANEVKYNDDGAIGGIMGSMATNALTGYFTQAVPTLLGQVARTVDNTRRTSDTIADDNFLAGVEKQGRKMANKIPFLSMINTPYVDARGEQQASSPYNNPLGNLAYQMLSPAYIREINTTDADIMARNAYNATTTDENGNEVPIHDKEVFAPWKGKVTYGGEKLDPQQMLEYRTESGRAGQEIRDALAHEDWFNELDGKSQNDILKKINTLVNKIGLEAAGYEQSSKELDAYKKGVPSLLDYLHAPQINKTIEEQTGLSATTNASKAIRADIEAGNEQAAQEKIDAAAVIQNNFTNAHVVGDYYKAQGVLPQLTPDQFVSTFKEMDTDNTQAIAVKELEGYINSHFGENQNEMAQNYWKAFYGGWKNKKGNEKKLKWDADKGQYVSYYD